MGIGSLRFDRQKCRFREFTRVERFAFIAIFRAVAGRKQIDLQLGTSVIQSYDESNVDNNRRRSEILSV